MYYKRLTKPPEVDFTDESRWVVPRGWCGTLSQLGKIRFYCKTDTLDLGKTGQENKESGWTVKGEYRKGDCVGLPGDLPSTDKRELVGKFWGKKPIQESAHRSFYVGWRCCGNPDEDFAEAFADPS